MLPCRAPCAWARGDVHAIVLKGHQCFGTVSSIERRHNVMSDKTAIHWTEATWNPVVGCTRVSAGCDHCYAFAQHDMRHVTWKRGRMPTAPAQYHKPFSHVQLMPDRLDVPLHWRKPRRVFVNSVSDLFHDAVPDAFIADVFA